MKISDKKLKFIIGARGYGKNEALKKQLKRGCSAIPKKQCICVDNTRDLHIVIDTLKEFRIEPLRVTGIDYKEIVYFICSNKCLFDIIDTLNYQGLFLHIPQIYGGRKK